VGRVVDQKNALVDVRQAFEDLPEGRNVLKDSQVGLDVMSYLFSSRDRMPASLVELSETM